MLLHKTINMDRIYKCDVCQYETRKKSNYTSHLQTFKHQRMTNVDQTVNLFSCPCGKSYLHRQGLWKHKTTCKVASTSTSTSTFASASAMTVYPHGKNKDDLIISLLKQNTDLMELLKHGTTNVITNTNSHNKAFNLNFFLNETCKNAMNLTEFIDSIKLQISDLEKVGEVGYVEGISHIITSNLKALDISLRPVHCTDQKREIMYIKDENKWEKEDANNNRLRRAIKRIANKNIRLLPQFRDNHPNYSDSSLKISSTYDKIVLEAMGGMGNNDVEKENKIIRNISRVAAIDKLMNE